MSAKFFGQLDTGSLTYKQQILIKGESYEKNNYVGNILVMLLVSIGGCWVPWNEGGRDGGYGRYDRGGGH